ncbi:MAG TPA: deoxyribodipyrimidine photo-lyase [Woeseiaceae bacterium]
MTHDTPAIVWFRQDLRTSDNPALHAASQSGRPIIPVYVLDDENAGDWRMGAASRWWLHHSLSSLQRSFGDRLVLLRGDASRLIPELAQATGAATVYWNRCYEPWRIARDSSVKTNLRQSGVEVRSFNGSLLWEPANTLKPNGEPYRVFTPFFRKGCVENGIPPREPMDAPAKLRAFDHYRGLELDALELLPKVRWYDGIAAAWSPGEGDARQQLMEFIATGLDGYSEGRDRPDRPFVSRLSPHLHFGELSPNQAWYAVKAARPEPDENSDRFLAELGWREFSYSLLYHEPTLIDRNLQRKFDRMAWQADDALLAAWQQGRTGVPFVDAGMRQLWRTGYVHNRVRMVVGSFLVKNLQQDWRSGARWFWDTLVDADLANNSASWQWVAGTGADAAPYFRIFNPVTQGRKFDPEGQYVRSYVPELAGLPDKYLHCPWEAPEEVLLAAGVRLGDTYPLPVVDLKASRERALAGFKSLSA